MHSKRFSIFWVFAFLLMFLNACNCRSELEGSWVGCEVRKAHIDWTLTIEDTHFSLVREDSDLWYMGLIRLNLNCRLKKIDMVIDDTSIPALRGKTVLGIFEIDGDSLTIASTQPGGHSRPQSFGEPGTTEFLFAKH